MATTELTLKKHIITTLRWWHATVAERGITRQFCESEKEWHHRVCLG